MLIDDILTWGLIVTAAIFLVSGLGEILVDIAFVCWRLVRLLQPRRSHSDLQQENLDAKPEKPAIIMVPTWQESAVIGRTLETMVARLRYRRYHILVGVYPNDAATMAVVSAEAARYDNVHMVVLDHDGPTVKADCLNGIIAAAHCLEERLGERFEIYVNNDAEDFVPPYELKVLNHFIPTYDVVQLPVFPLPAAWYNFTAGHYMGEFAHQHLRDMSLREWLTGAIPTAGVGCGFSRRFVDASAEINGGLVFAVDSLAEDYEISLKMNHRGMRQLFVDTPVLPPAGEKHPRWADMLPAVREDFPSHFGAAVRQKSRWIIGIALQGWEILGWEGSFLERYMYFRDRKSLAANLVVAVGYFLMLATLAIWGWRSWLLQDRHFPIQLEPYSWVAYVIWLNLALMAVQLCTRFMAVWIIYGFGTALLSPLRVVWGNIINMAATYRAVALYWQARNRSARPAWEKTEHQNSGNRHGV